jgi:hypothetical protein
MTYILYFFQDLNNDDSVLLHLTAVLKNVPLLICSKCGFTRRSPRLYQEHMKTCDAASLGEICENKHELLQKNDGIYLFIVIYIYSLVWCPG